MVERLKEKQKSSVLETFQKWMVQESQSRQPCECYLEAVTGGQERGEHLLWSERRKPDCSGSAKWRRKQ